MCLVGFVVVMTVMVISFGIVPFLLWLRSVKHPEFHDLMEMDKSS